MTDLEKQSGGLWEPDLSGRQLADFRLLRRFGQGAMATVYLAEQGSLKRQVAIKVLRNRLATDPTYVQRFRREAQAAAALVHANIVQIYEVGEVEGVHYIAQEYVQGQNLCQWLQRNGSANLRVGVAVLRQAAAALAKAAEHGIVHRDIKPENILLTQSGEVKVADFGLAQVADPNEAASLTQIGATVGTPLYMSPEQVEGKTLDPRSDIYSLGVTCYHVLSGSPPFTGESAVSVAVQHLKKQPIPLEKARPDLPPALCRIVHKMMSKTPDARYASVREVLRELQQVQTQHLDEPWPDELPGKEAASVMSANAGTLDASQRLDSLMRTIELNSRQRRRWASWTVAAIAACLLGGVLGYVATEEPPLLALAPEVAPSVPRQETVFAQWVYATSLATEDAWKSIKRHFGDNEFWCRRADQKLACLYLQEGRHDEAMAIFSRLASLEAPEAEWKAFGLAGQCAVYAIRKQYQQAAVVLAQLWPIRTELRDVQMRSLLQRAVQVTREELGEQTTRQWQGYLEEQFPEAR